MKVIEYWSVRVLVEPGESTAMSGELHHAFTSDVRRLRHSPADSDDFNGPSTITLEIRAPSANAARITAQHLLGEVRRHAGIPVAESRIVWVAPLAPELESSHRFLEAAEELLDGEQYELAVVAAQIHIELHLSTLLRMLVAADESPVARALMASRIEWTQTQPWQRDLFEHLLSVSLPKAFPEWKGYIAHVERRNAIVHRGQVVDRESAKESLQVVSEFWRWLNEAASRSME